jgi:hypothetical protein
MTELEYTHVVHTFLATLNALDDSCRSLVPWPSSPRPPTGYTRCSTNVRAQVYVGLIFDATK